MAQQRGRLTKPALAAGALKDLNDALHDLLQRAGRPSVRELETDLRASKLLPVPPSHTRIYDVFVRGRLPDCDLLACLVQVMALRATRLDPRVQVDSEGERFFHLWLTADKEKQAEYDALDARTSPATEAVRTYRPMLGSATAAHANVTPEATMISAKPSTAIRSFLPDPAASNLLIIGSSHFDHLEELPALGMVYGH